MCADMYRLGGAGLGIWLMGKLGHACVVVVWVMCWWVLKAVLYYLDMGGGGRLGEEDNTESVS